MMSTIANKRYEIQQHIGWLKMFLDGMTENNWRDMQMYAGRQVMRLSDALEHAEASNNVEQRCPPRHRA